MALRLATLRQRSQPLLSEHLFHHALRHGSEGSPALHADDRRHRLPTPSDQELVLGEGDAVDEGGELLA